MSKNQYFIEKLNQELLNGIETPPDKTSVVNAFEKYVANKDFLHSVVSYGIFYYDFNIFNKSIKGTHFEELLDVYICACHNAYITDEFKTIEAINKFYPQISEGFRSVTELNLINNIEFDESRLDLIARYYINNIGAIIESALKPHVMFLDSIFSIVNKKETQSTNFGNAVYYISGRDTIIDYCYKKSFEDIAINQWRNIANHNDYCVLNNNKIQIRYGVKNKKSKDITKQSLMNIANQLNLLLYTNKIGFTLFSIDNFSKIKLNKLFKYENTLNDDKISQLVESSYAFGYKLINDELIQNKKQITVEAIKGCDNSKEHVTEYLICITKFIATDYSLKVLEQNGKVKYFANCEKKTLKIFSFNT